MSKAKIASELNALNPAGRGPLQQIEKPLAGYQMAAAVTGTRPAKAETMQTLRDGLETLHQVRTEIPDRSNVWSDAKENQGQAIYMRAGGSAVSSALTDAYMKKTFDQPMDQRDHALLNSLPHDLETRMDQRGMTTNQKMGYVDSIASTATARASGAAVCDDLTAAASSRHAPKLLPGQSLERFSSPVHTWPSVTLSGAAPNHGENVLLEAWAQDKNNMTPITREHGHFPNTGEKRRDLYSLDGKISDMAAGDVAAIEASLKHNPTAQSMRSDAQEHSRARHQEGGGLQQLQDHFDDRARRGESLEGYQHGDTFASTPPLLDKGFRREAHQGLNRLENPDPLAAGPNLTKAMKRDILATGIARDLGFSVGDAPGVAAQHGHFLGDARRVLGPEPAPDPAPVPLVPRRRQPEASTSSEAPAISAAGSPEAGSSRRGFKGKLRSVMNIFKPKS